MSKLVLSEESTTVQSSHRFSLLTLNSRLSNLSRPDVIYEINITKITICML